MAGRARGAYRPDCAREIAAIEARRAELGVGMGYFAMRAGVSERTLRRMVKEGRGWKRHVRALRLALRSIGAELRQEEAGGAPRLIDRAAEVGMRSVRIAVEAADLPERLRNPVTLYLLVTLLNVPGAVAATVAGCTRQNVSKVLRSVEDRLDDPAFARVIEDLERKLL